MSKFTVTINCRNPTVHCIRKSDGVVLPWPRVLTVTGQDNEDDAIHIACQSLSIDRDLVDCDIELCE